MADHSELIAEMAIVEKMSTQERLKHAKKRRLQQLKKWSNREKEVNAKRKKTEQNMNKKIKKHDYKVHFVPSVMLLEAAARNDIDEVQRLLMLGVSPDSTNEDGLTALHQCCIDDSEEMMKLLLDFGANVNAKDSEQWTPLHAAATCGHLHLVKYLISKDADLLAVNADGNMPYDICEDEATLDYIESEMAKRGITQEMIDETRAQPERYMLSDLKNLVENGDDLEYRDHQGATPLHIAAANGYVAVVEFLLDHHVSTDINDNDFWQPIHAAACWGHPDVIELLVQAGADLNAKTKNGETPFDICEDPDLKDRLMQLKNEQEIKRASQPQKLRRSQSQNTRSQSVRRTSIRDKSLMSRREAQEEARIRQEKQEQNRNEEDEEGRVQNDDSHYNKNSILGIDDIDVVLPPINTKDTFQRIKCKGINDDNEACDDAAYVTKVFDEALAGEKESLTQDIVQSQELINSHEDAKEYFINPEDNVNINPSITSSSPPPSYVDVSQTSVPGFNQGESVKVEIHVTVNTSPTYSPSACTLADLKKHRSDMRTRSSLSLSSSQQDINGKVSNSGHHFSATYRYEPPPSPTISLRRYCSDPSEIVGEPQKQGCCTIM